MGRLVAGAVAGVAGYYLRGAVDDYRMRVVLRRLYATLDPC